MLNVWTVLEDKGFWRDSAQFAHMHFEQLIWCFLSFECGYYVMFLSFNLVHYRFSLAIISVCSLFRLAADRIDDSRSITLSLYLSHTHTHGSIQNSSLIIRMYVEQHDHAALKFSPKRRTLEFHWSFNHKSIVNLFDRYASFIPLQLRSSSYIYVSLRRRTRKTHANIFCTMFLPASHALDIWLA